MLPKELMKVERINLKSDIDTRECNSNLYFVMAITLSDLQNVFQIVPTNKYDGNVLFVLSKTQNHK